MATTNDYMASEAKHYVTIFMRARVGKSEVARNLEPHKCKGWKWLSWEQVMALPQSRLFMPIVHLLNENLFDPQS